MYAVLTILHMYSKTLPSPTMTSPCAEIIYKSSSTEVLSAFLNSHLLCSTKTYGKKTDVFPALGDLPNAMAMILCSFAVSSSTIQKSKPKSTCLPTPKAP